MVTTLLMVESSQVSAGSAWAWVIAALLLIAAEFVLPGMIIGIIGGIAGLYGLFLAAQSSMTDFALTTTALLLGVVLEFLIFRKLAPNVAKHLGLASPTSDAGAAVPSAASFADLVGREGFALTALAPGGSAEIAGRRVQASSIDGFLDKGTRVVVCETVPGGVTVRRI
jgi:membrane-bound serine protease (ClpP class)